MRAFLLLLLTGCLSGCKSADEWGKDADEEVYSILHEHLEELVGEDAPAFSLEPPADPLRARLLAGDPAMAGQPLALGLVECLQVAAENSRDWQEQREQLFRSALDLTLERWNFSAQQNATLGGFVSGIGFGRETEVEGGFLSNLNVFKLLGIGTRITADLGIDLLEAVGNGDAWDALTHLSLNITQPLLRGFGEDIVKEPLTQAERDVLYQARAYERFRHTFAIDVAQRFFRVLEQVDRLKNEEANLANLVRLRERNEALAEAGRLTDIQVDQARQDELSAEDRLVAARRDLEAGLDDFKFVLGLPIETALELEDRGLRSLEAWPQLELDFPEERVLHAGLERRLDHATARDRVEDAQRGVNVAADALRAGLDLSGTGVLVSEGDEPDQLRTNDVDWIANLELDLPIDRIPERNVYRNARITLEERRRGAEESADRVTSELRDALRNRDAARASYRIQNGSVQLALRRVESAALNLDAGRADTRDVLEAQESLLSAQNSLAGALTDTILAGLFLYRDMELLEVSANGIEVLLLETAEALP